MSIQPKVAVESLFTQGLAEQLAHFEEVLERRKLELATSNADLQTLTAVLMEIVRTEAPADRRVLNLLDQLRMTGALYFHASRAIGDIETTIARLKEMLHNTQSAS